METKSKKKIYNIAMIIIIAVIVFCGIMAIGHLKGWFGGDDEKANRDFAKTETQVGIENDEDKGENEEYTLNSGDEDTQEKAGKASTETSAKISKCTITIKCSSILNNIDSLKAGKESYVPSNGIILSTSTVEFADGSSAYDILKRVCSAAGIQLEAAYTPAYESYYVEGINHLYEFDCGDQSGWIYKVNGRAPSYGASQYTVKNGDSIVWGYTCKGMGSDVH